MQALVRAGYVSDDLEFNDGYKGYGNEGGRALLDILFEEYKEKLVAKAKEKIAEYEAKQKAN